MIDPIYVCVIVLSNFEAPSRMVTFEGGTPPTETALTGLARNTGILANAIYYGGTHSHTSPRVRVDPEGASDLDTERGVT